MDNRRLRAVPAQDRVDRLNFSGRAEFDDHVVHVGAYTCPHCGTVAAFNTGTLRKAEEQTDSPLGDVWSARCQAVRPKSAWEYGLDFSCRGCESPVRIIFAAGEEFAMGAHTHDILDVIEEGGAP